MSNYNNNQNNQNKTNPIVGIIKIAGAIVGTIGAAVFSAEAGHRVSENKSRENAKRVAMQENNGGKD